MRVKIGFEVHQQLNTSKLFCHCPSLLREDEPSYNYLRSLRPTQSELGEIDEAALKEFLKGKRYLYQGYGDTTCLVEIDEEPPHSPNSDAIDTAIEVALLVNADIVDEIHFMRKLVIDGSNTSGFQRTAIVALDGRLKINDYEIEIPTICLEEEAARKIAEKDNQTIYRLDRLGIPLVEITTAPDITTPAQAKKAALKIGELLRSTAKVKRGLGTIRQDINVSIEGGARVEIKGVQDLNQIPMVIEKEIERQEMLVLVKKELQSLGITRDMLEFKLTDVTEALKDSDSKLIKRQLAKGVALALVLPGFNGLLKGKLGPELAQHARLVSGLGGILHSDELPGYGVAEKEVKNLVALLGIGDNDAFVLAISAKVTAKKALKAVFERALMALDGVPEETRVANQDGTTAYMRPLPGAARMYPETDIPPIVITKDRIAQIEANLPESYEEKKKRYVTEHGLSEEMASQLLAATTAEKPAWQIYDDLAGSVDVNPAVVANTLLGIMPELRREGYEVDRVSMDKLREIFQLVGKGEIAKEAIPPMIAAVSKNPEIPIAELVKGVGMGSFDEDGLRNLIRKILKEREDFIKEKGALATKPLMGLVMKEVRGKVDGKLVNQLLNEELDKFL
jgi:glutamyl-tRNA(Gln) amidotransferase subunit E